MPAYYHTCGPEHAALKVFTGDNNKYAMHCVQIQDTTMYATDGCVAAVVPVLKGNEDTNTAPPTPDGVHPVNRPVLLDPEEIAQSLKGAARGSMAKAKPGLARILLGQKNGQLGTAILAAYNGTQQSVATVREPESASFPPVRDAIPPAKAPDNQTCVVYLNADLLEKVANYAAKYTDRKLRIQIHKTGHAVRFDFTFKDGRRGIVALMPLDMKNDELGPEDKTQEEDAP